MFRRMVCQPFLQAHYRRIKSLFCEYDVLLYFHCIREAKCSSQAAFHRMEEAFSRFTCLAGRPQGSSLPYTSFAFATALWKTSEVVHTNQKHLFFTLEEGFLPVGQIKLGMHLLRADGCVGVVTGWKVVPGTQVMYNLEVAQDHAFTVGLGSGSCISMAWRGRPMVHVLRLAAVIGRCISGKFPQSMLQRVREQGIEASNVPGSHKILV